MIINHVKICKNDVRRWNIFSENIDILNKETWKFNTEWKKVKITVFYFLLFAFYRMNFGRSRREEGILGRNGSCRYKQDGCK